MLSTDKQINKQTNKQTDRQTNQRHQKHNLLCQGGNYVEQDVMSNFQWMGTHLHERGLTRVDFDIRKTTFQSVFTNRGCEGLFNVVKGIEFVMIKASELLKITFRGILSEMSIE